MAKSRLIGDYPVIGIRPTIDGRRGTQMCIRDRCGVQAGIPGALDLHTDWRVHLPGLAGISA